jgi:enterochelin esterase family protein
MKVSFLFKIYYRLFSVAFLVFAHLSFATPPLSSSRAQLNDWDQPNLQRPKGQVMSYHFSSRILRNKRDVWVYTPPSYEWKKGPYPLLIVFDGQAYTSQLIPGPTILDNLIAKGKIPPLVAVFVSSIDQPTRNRELPCHSRFISCLTQELIPWISRRYFVTKNPSQTIVAGSSYGGLAAAYAALCHPERFGNVLSQSGAFWWQPSSNSSKPWLAEQFEAVPSISVRFYLDVGDRETDSTDGRMSMVDVNRYLRKTLEQKGCQVTYYEFKGGHDYACWRKTFAIGLMALLGDKKQKSMTDLE